jgi:hypothetical protein
MADMTDEIAAAPPLVCGLVDESVYAASVAEHGAWLAERLRAGLELRHVREGQETPPQGRDLLEALAATLADQGAPRPRLSLGEGGVLGSALSAGAAALVMGKRGTRADLSRDHLGRPVEPLVRAMTVPICLASQVFLPIHRVVAVTDADPNRRAAIDLVALHAGPDVELDVLVVSREGEVADDKVALARQALDGRAQAFAIRAERIGEGVWRYLRDRPSDLIVISRAVLLDDNGPGLSAAPPGSFWSARASVVVC